MFQGTTLTEQITEWLAEQIISGEMKPGQPLYETKLTSELGVSRAPLREALRDLAKEGLVTLVPRRSAAVSAMNKKDASDLYECRSNLEALCTRLATEALGTRELSELQEVLRDMERAFEASDTVAYQKLNASFHETLYSYCPNATVVEVIQLLWRRTERYRRLLARDSQQMGASMAAHQKLMGSLLRNAPGESEQNMRDLIDGASRALSTKLDALSAQMPTMDKKREPE